MIGAAMTEILTTEGRGLREAGLIEIINSGKNSILWCLLFQNRFCISYYSVGLFGVELLFTPR